MKMKFPDKEEFFLSTAHKISSSLGYSYSREDILRMCGEDYLLHFQPLKNNHIHIGIWPVGRWWFCRSNPPTEWDLYFASSEIESVYGSEFPDFTICVFCCHDWDMDMFRPTFAHWRGILTQGADNFEKELDESISYIKSLFKNKIDSYYSIVDYDAICNCHHDPNKIHAYYKAWFRNKILKPIKQLIRHDIKPSQN